MRSGEGPGDPGMDWVGEKERVNNFDWWLGLKMGRILIEQVHGQLNVCFYLEGGVRLS